MPEKNDLCPGCDAARAFYAVCQDSQCSQQQLTSYVKITNCDELYAGVYYDPNVIDEYRFFPLARAYAN